MRLIALVAAAFLADSAQAATYEYDYDKRELSLDGTVQSQIDFALGREFNLRFSFDQGWLTSDNPVFISAVVHAGTRITFKPLPQPSSVLGFDLYFAGSTPFEYQADFRNHPTGGFSAYFDWNQYDCVTDRTGCAFGDKLNGFLHGYGSDPRQSTYSVSVSSVPVPSSSIALVSAVMALLAAGNLTLRRS